MPRADQTLKLTVALDTGREVIIHMSEDEAVDMGMRLIEEVARRRGVNIASGPPADESALDDIYTAVLDVFHRDCGN